MNSIIAGLSTGLGNEAGINPEERQQALLRQQREAEYRQHMASQQQPMWENPNQIVWPQGDGQQAKGGSPYEHTPGYDEGWPPKAPQKTPTPAPKPNVALDSTNFFGGSNLSNAVGNMNGMQLANLPNFGANTIDYSGHRGAMRGAKINNLTRSNTSASEVEAAKRMLGGPSLPPL